MGKQVGETSRELVKGLHNVRASVLLAHEMKVCDSRRHRESDRRQNIMKCMEFQIAFIALQRFDLGLYDLFLPLKVVILVVAYFSLRLAWST
jgi:hypothetical protein